MAGVVDESILELLNVEQAAKRLNVAAVTVRRLCKNGELESVKIGTRRLIPPAAIFAYVEQLRARQNPDVA